MGNWSSIAKTTSSFSKAVKPSDSFSSQDKGSASFAELIKNVVDGFLLMEDGYFLLQENLYKIIINRGWDIVPETSSLYTKIAK